LPGRVLDRFGEMLLGNAVENDVEKQTRRKNALDRIL
jgi:hypothetical protein